jgi:hypothetical protein
LKEFVDGNLEWNFYTFIRLNQEQLRKMQLLSALWQELKLQPCNSGAVLLSVFFDIAQY